MSLKNCEHILYRLYPQNLCYCVCVWVFVLPIQRIDWHPLFVLGKHVRFFGVIIVILCKSQQINRQTETSRINRKKHTHTNIPIALKIRNVNTAVFQPKIPIYSIKWCTMVRLCNDLMYNEWKARIHYEYVDITALFNILAFYLFSVFALTVIVERVNKIRT